MRAEDHPDHPNQQMQRIAAEFKAMHEDMDRRLTGVIVEIQELHKTVKGLAKMIERLAQRLSLGGNLPPRDPEQKD